MELEIKKIVCETYTYKSNGHTLKIFPYKRVELDGKTIKISGDKFKFLRIIAESDKYGGLNSNEMYLVFNGQPLKWTDTRTISQHSFHASKMIKPFKIIKSNRIFKLIFVDETIKKGT